VSVTNVAPERPADVAPPSRQRHSRRRDSRQRHSRQRVIRVVVLVVLLLAGVSVPAVTGDWDMYGTAAVSLLSWLSAAVAALSWPVLLSLVAVSGLHYVAAAASARAAAGVRMPFGELVAVQFAAAAANRVTPVGVGGLTVLGRYVTRRTRLQPSQAAAAMSALAVLGGVADAVAFALLIGLGALLGLAGVSGEVPLLVNKFAGLVPVPSGGWPWVVIGAVVAAVVIVSTSRLRKHAVGHRIVEALRGYAHTLGVLMRRPGRLAALMGASASTTLLLATGFAAASTLGSRALPPSSFFALMVGYMVASAASNAIPTPGGIGSAELALMGVLVAARMPVASALSTVLAFRLVTFWTPAVIGAFLVRPLRRRGAL
jgi:uncharacterized membrane protein YbhN (UPF0104 family)